MRLRAQLVLLLLLATLPLAAWEWALRPVAAQEVPTVTPLPGLATLQPVFIITPTPTATPGCAAPLPLAAGDFAFVRAGTNVRSQPTTSGALVNYYGEAVTVRVVDGPVCANDYNWWQVRGPGEDGWVAEGRPDAYFVRPAPKADTGCPAPAQLSIGGRTEILTGVRLRDQAADTGLVLTVAPQGTLADVLEGPVCAGGQNWWRLRATVLNVVYTGWAAEGFPGERYLQAEGADLLPVCAPPLNLKVGQRAYVDYPDNNPRNLRAAPGLNAELVATLIDGIGFEIIGGPACADDINWWQIRIVARPDVTGWFAEGGPSQYWITPLYDFNQFDKQSAGDE